MVLLYPAPTCRSTSGSRVTGIGIWSTIFSCHHRDVVQSHDISRYWGARTSAKIFSLGTRWKGAMLFNQTQPACVLATVEQVVEVADGCALMSGRQLPPSCGELKQCNLEQE